MLREESERVLLTYVKLLHSNIDTVVIVGSFSPAAFGPFKHENDAK